MKLDINEIYHNYIVRIVIFSLFAYKRIVRQPSVYQNSVQSFVNKRVAWKINLHIDSGIKMSKDEEREIVLNEILDGVESSYLTTVVVSFTTPLKDITIEVDLRDEEKYQNFLYL